MSELISETSTTTNHVQGAIKPANARAFQTLLFWWFLQKYSIPFVIEGAKNIRRKAIRNGSPDTTLNIPVNAKRTIAKMPEINATLKVLISAGAG
jgi:hypothetical protein